MVICSIDHTPHSKGVIISARSVPRTDALTINVEEDVPEKLRGIVFIGILYVVDSLSVYGKILQERRNTDTKRIEAE